MPLMSIDLINLMPPTTTAAGAATSVAQLPLMSTTASVNRFTWTVVFKKYPLEDVLMCAVVVKLFLDISNFDLFKESMAPVAGDVGPIKKQTAVVTFLERDNALLSIRIIDEPWT